MSFQTTDRQRRWLNTLLVLGTITVALLLLGLVANVLLFFSDILLIFFLAWLLAFVLSPFVTVIDRATPRLPRALAVVVTYVLLLAALSFAAIILAQSLAASITSFVTSVPLLQARLPELIAPWQSWLNSLGLDVDLLVGAQSVLGSLGTFGGNLVQPLSGLALASLGIFGNFLFIVILSLYMVVDGERIIAFFIRLVPPGRAEEARLFQRSVALSFGGFLRGQAIMGFLYGLTAGVAHVIFGLDYGPASSTASGVLMAVPFFGPFLSWAPPVVVAALTKPDVVLPTLAVMGIGWFVIMNVIQPKIMASAVGIHPIVVLGSIIVGLKLAGIPGAIFGIPIAAVLSSFFFHYLNQTGAASRDVTSRAARLVESREGRRVRVPAPPPLPPREGGEPRVRQQAVRPATAGASAGGGNASAATDQTSTATGAFSPTPGEPGTPTAPAAPDIADGPAPDPRPT
jgi:predicted PurR-regulated permease PerM